MTAAVRGRGRPRGRFDYHKLRVLAYLQQHSPYSGNWEELRQAMAAEEVYVCTRQLERYVHQLELEETPEGQPRVEIGYVRIKQEDGSVARRRVLICHDTRPLNF
jgi:hypothetical protein